MSFNVKILAHSRAPSAWDLATIEATYPRFIHAELLTHRMFSRNSASSRATPNAKMLERIEKNPVVPIMWGKNRAGMQATESVDDEAAAAAEQWWLQGRDMMVAHARKGHELGLHKQIVNRVTEPWMWITVILSATHWDNFFGLRVHEAAEPHFQKIAGMIKDELSASTPKQLDKGQWHMPLIYDRDREMAEERWGAQATENLVKISVARCGRVSYLTHDGKRDFDKDLELYDKLLAAQPLHASPAEHVAMALDTADRSGNFVGWKQHRKFLVHEHIGGPMP